MAGPSHVVHDLVLTPFLQRLPDAPTQIVQDLVPGHSFPLALAALSCPTQRIQNPLGIVDLVDRCRPLGTVSSPAPWVRRIAFELLDPHLFLIDVGQQSARGFTVEANGRDQRIMLLDLAWPLRSIELRPVVPAIGRRKTGESILRR